MHADIDRIKTGINLVRYVSQVLGLEPKRVGVNTWRFNPCPVCGGNDHFTVSFNGEAWLYHSFAECCDGGSIIDFVQQIEGAADFKAAINHLADQYPWIRSGMDNQTLTKQRQKPQSKAKKKDVAPLPDMRVDFELLHRNMSDDNYFTRRGIGQDVQDEYLLCTIDDRGFDRFIDEYAELIDQKTPYTSLYKHFIPVIDPDGAVRHFLPYLDKDAAHMDEKTPKVRNLTGRQARFFNDRYLIKPPFDNGYIFVCEGVFDALSFETIGCKAISINSASNVRRLADMIQQNKEKYKDITFVLAFDNDDAGRDATERAIELLQDNGVDVDVFEFDGQYKDINELLQAGKHLLIQALEAFETQRENKQLKELGNASLLIDEFIDEINKNMNTSGISTGFDNLDQSLGGGLYAGLYTLGAISSLGKTTLALQIADNIAASGHDVIFFSLEMSANEVLAKSFSRISAELAQKGQMEDYYTTRAILNGIPTVDEYTKMEKQYNRIAQNMYIVEGNFHADLAMIQRHIDKHVRIRKTKPVVVVDYLQILLPESDRLTDKQAVDRNIVGLKRLSREFDIPVLLISSFNRDNYLNPVSYASFKESGAIEYSSDVILGLQLLVVHEVAEEKNKTKKENILNEAKNQVPREVELVILKNRNGKAFDQLAFKYYPNANFFEEDDIFEDLENKTLGLRTVPIPNGTTGKKYEEWES